MLGIDATRLYYERLRLSWENEEVSEDGRRTIYKQRLIVQTQPRNDGALSLEIRMCTGTRLRGGSISCNVDCLYEYSNGGLNTDGAWTNMRSKSALKSKIYSRKGIIPS